MSDNDGERRSFRSGGSTPRSGRGDSGERRQGGDRGPARGEDRRQGVAGRPDRRGEDRTFRGERRSEPAKGSADDSRGSSRSERPHSDRPSGDRRDRPYGERRDDRSRDDRSRDDRSRSERPHRGTNDDRRDDRRTGDRRDDRGRDDRRTGTSRAGHGPERRDGGAPRRRGGEGGFGPSRGREGAPAPRREARPDEPDLPEDVEASDLDPTIRRDLLSLDKSNANAVARHLVMAGHLIDDDPRLALAHARAARQRAGRIAVVREAAGITAYHAGEWAEALSELRAARRMAGGPGLLAVMADCERGLGRPERAIELGRSDEARALTGDEATELRIVVAGARMDLGQFDQAVVTLQTPDLDASRTGPSAARLFYAYADALVAAGRTEDGLKWFLNAAAADLEGDTDAEERVAELTGEDQ
ncbi:hypothetical protein ACFYSW_03375 [Rhodococcus aetherivorans]|uniref:tetratricopeptide repeat protein n=1 Tax=Rhodococcus aetherivorans TaxID=191292 RepID=UPI00368E2722